MAPTEEPIDVVYAAVQFERCSHARTAVEHARALNNYASRLLEEAVWNEKLESAANRGWVSQTERQHILRGDFEAFHKAKTGEA